MPLTLSDPDGGHFDCTSVLKYSVQPLSLFSLINDMAAWLGGGVCLLVVSVYINMKYGRKHSVVHSSRMSRA